MFQPTDIYQVYFAFIKWSSLRYKLNLSSSDMIKFVHQNNCCESFLCPKLISIYFYFWNLRGNVPLNKLLPQIYMFVILSAWFWTINVIIRLLSNCYRSNLPEIKYIWFFSCISTDSGRNYTGNSGMDRTHISSQVIWNTRAKVWWNFRCNINEYKTLYESLFLTFSHNSFTKIISCILLIVLRIYFFMNPV